ncbi:McrB family protein [Myroides odoratimimus]|uniref:McrB family protein n=1 Tax=Myroides odoratimimus TaxID=76832 RepID=UPI002574DDDE|nr:AAA family ATPase [Myroides odoratimimus]
MEELEKKAWKEALEYAFNQLKSIKDFGKNAFKNYAIENEGKLYPNKQVLYHCEIFLNKKYPKFSVTKQLGGGKPINDFLESKGANALTLNQVMDSNVDYWLYQPGENARLWNEFYEKSIIGLGWDDLGDLSLYQSKDDVVKELQALYQTESSKKNDATANWDFCQNMQIGDIVLIKKGKRKLLGYGEVISDYIFDAEREEYASIRKVKWIKKGEWDIDFDLVLKTLTIITDYDSDVLKGQKYYQYLLSIMNGNISRVNSERISLIKYKKQIILQGPPGTGKTREAKLIAKEMLGLQDVKKLEGNDQFKLIQFHPSYTYEDFVRGIVSKPNEDGDGIIYEAENKLLADFAQKALDNYIESNKTNVVVHEDSSIFEAFIENIKDELAQNEHHKYDITEAVYLFSADETRFKYKGDNWVAHSKGLNMKFSELKKIIDSGATERQDIKKMTDVEELTRQHATYFIKIVEKYYTFKQTFKESTPLQHSIELKNYVLIIDEINRANLSSVLGELIYALEYRGEAVESMYAVDNDNKLVLPSNLYIIGTMNTADRSVGHIDYAIRRRFAFVDVLPQDLSNDENIIFDSKLFGQVAELFDTHLSPEFEKKDVQLGHSYFIDKTKEGGSMDIRLNYEIKPILFEYVKDGVLIGEDIKKLIEDLEPSI